MCMQHMHVEQNANRSLGNKVKSTGVRTRIPVEITLEALSSHSFQFEIPNRLEAYEKKTYIVRLLLQPSKNSSRMLKKIARRRDVMHPQLLQEVMQTSHLGLKSPSC